MIAELKAVAEELNNKLDFERPIPTKPFEHPIRMDFIQAFVHQLFLGINSIQPDDELSEKTLEWVKILKQKGRMEVMMDLIEEEKKNMAIMKKNETELIASASWKKVFGFTADYAVASELCRRGVYAHLTFNLFYPTNLIVETENGKMIRIMVDAKQGRQWPGLKGVSGTGMVLVLVDYENKQLNQRPDFYILTPGDWRTFIQEKLIKTGQVNKGRVSLDENFVPKWDDKFVGIGVKQEEIANYKERWETIISA